MPSGLSQSHQEIAGQFQRELLQLIGLGSGGQHVQRPLPRGMGRPIGLQCPCNSFTRQEVRGASDSTNQRIENNALVSSSGITGGARRVVYLVVSYSPVRGSAKDTRLRLHLDRQVIMVQTADGSPGEGASRNGDDMSNPMWAHILRLLDDEEQATMVFQIFKRRGLRLRQAPRARGGMGRCSTARDGRRVQVASDAGQQGHASLTGLRQGVLHLRDRRRRGGPEGPPSNDHQDKLQMR